MNERKYYIYYEERPPQGLNYCFLLAMYAIAKRNNSERICNIIEYKSLRDLQSKLAAAGYKTSLSSLQRYTEKDYLNYYTIERKYKRIVLQNNFKQKKNCRFIVLSENNLSFLLERNDNFLCRYYFYIKYFCGYSKTKSTDFTAEQFITAVGLSFGGGNRQKVCMCNKLLANEGLVIIESYRDPLGHKRNVYKIPLTKPKGFVL